MRYLTHVLVLCSSLLLFSADASAFCGFYVAGADDELFNDATQVVLMREGTQTVLSMQNNYKGPIKNFAMVVPVPVVLMQDDVKTLPVDVFERIDTLSAPRLVEYFEQDPCYTEPPYEEWWDVDMSAGGVPEDMGSAPVVEPAPVVVEAQFEAGEYEIVILSATEATSLETWLTTNNYSIPAGAAPLFEQYIEQGMYFFVAKVDPAKVTFEDGQAVLSPLRFSYESDTFSLPVRLGMVNSAGQQDLLVYTLGRNQRYEVANYPNVTIPTNIVVGQSTRDSFGAFYRQLFDRTLQQNPGAVITEYAWTATHCDPCPGPILDPEDIATFGADVLESEGSWSVANDPSWVITRLHTRYGKDEISEDLVFNTAPPIVGGRGTPSGANAVLGEKVGSTEGAHWNNFQGRYIMLDGWSGDVDCADPVYGRWGHPSSRPQAAVSPNSGGDTTSPSDGTESESSGGGALEEFIEEDVEQIDVKAESPGSWRNSGATEPAPSGAGCQGGCASAGGPAVPAGALALFLLGGVIRRRTRREGRA